MKWRKWPWKDGGGVDQLQWVVDEIKADPNCHNAIVTSWNPEYLYAMAKPGEACRFPICHNMFQVNINQGKLCLQLYQRSADIFLGVPFNIASYALLTMILAKITGYEPGEFVHTFGDVHIYENHIEQAKEQIGREPFAFPKVTISDEVTSLDSFRPEHVTLGATKHILQLKPRWQLLAASMPTCTLTVKRITNVEIICCRRNRR